MNFTNKQLKLSKNKMAFLGRKDITGSAKRLNIVGGSETLEGRGGWTIQSSFQMV